MQGYYYARPMPTSEYEALAARSEKQRATPMLETVENLDNNAFWSPDSMDTLIFNSYLGGACIFEYNAGMIELLRANDKYIQVIGSAGMTIDDALRLNWVDYMENETRERLASVLVTIADSGEERSFEFAFHDLPGCGERTYLKASLRVIARIGQCFLIYSTNENITAQRLAEEKRAETTDQLSFLESVAHELLTMDNPEEGINTLLGRMLAYFDGERGYVFELDRVHGTTSNSYEVCADGVSAQKHRLQGVPLTSIQSWLDAFAKHNYIAIASVNALGVDRKEKDILQAQGIRSLVAVPLTKNNELIGFIGIDDPRQRQHQIESLTALGDYAAVLLARRDLNARIESDDQEKIAVMDGIPGGFVRMIVRPDGIVQPIYQSEGLKRLVNMNQEELDALYKTDAMGGVHPDDLEDVQKKVAAMIRDGEGHNIRYRLQRGGGGYVWVTIFGKVQKSANGEVFLNVYYADATEEKKREDDQISLLDNLPCGAALYDVKGTTLTPIHLNRHYWELVNRAPVDVNDLKVMEAILPDDRPTVSEEIKAALSENRDAVCNVRIRYGEDHYRFFHVVGRFIRQDGGGMMLCATYTPVDDEAMRLQDILPMILSAVMESTSDLSFVKSKDLHYLYGSSAFRAMVGVDSIQGLIGKTDADLFTPEIAAKYHQDDLALLASGKSLIDMIESLPSPDGAPRYARTSKFLLRDGSGAIVGLYGSGRDVTEEQRMTEKLRISEEQYRLATQHTGSTVCRYTFADDTLILPAEAARDWALPEHLVGMPQAMLSRGMIAKESEKIYMDFFARIRSGEKSGSMVFQCRMKDRWRWLEEHFSTVFSAGKPLFTVISYADVTDRQEKELIYNKWQQSLTDKDPEDYTLFRCNISKLVANDMRDGKLITVSFGDKARSFNERTKVYASSFVAEEDRKEYQALLNTDALLTGYYHGLRYRTLEYREKQANGSVRWISLTIELVEYPNSSDVEAYLMYENIDDEKRAELKIKEHAEMDPLTGLYNRAAFADKLTARLTAREQVTSGALLMLDLDDFKLVNDRFGHIAGDQVLITVGTRLQALLRADDLICRLGGDEFLIYMNDLTDRAVMSRRADELSEKIRLPFETTATVTTSMGIAIVPEDGDDFETLYRKADAALYHAKRAGKNCHAFFEAGMEEENTRA